MEVALRTFRGNRLYALAGLAHIPDLEQELAARGIEAKINTAIFAHEGKVKKNLALVEDRLITPLKQNKFGSEREASAAVDSVLWGLKQRRQEPPAVIRKRLAAAIEKRDTICRKRWSKKAATASAKKRLRPR